MSNFKEIWDRRSLIFALANHDLKMRYKNSVLGFFWSFLEPLLLLTVLYFIFTNILRPDIEFYQLYLFLGIIMWNTVSRGTSMGLNSITQRAGLVSKTYFPREVLVISSTLTAFYMMFFEFAVFVVFAVFLQIVPPVSILLFPVMLLILFILTLGISFSLSVLYVKYRDIGSIWNVVLTAGFFLAPIIYSIEIFPESVRGYLFLNPFVSILDISHNLVLYNIWPSLSYFLQASIIPIIILFVGILIFKKLDKTIIEEI